MKVFSFLVLTFLIKSVMAAPADDFVITVKTDNTGSGTDTEYTIFTNSNYAYNYNVDCDNDGVDEASFQTGDYTCNYRDPGICTIRIKDKTGTGNGFPSFKLLRGIDSVSRKIIAVEQWGTGIWLDMNSAFRVAVNLEINATDVPDFSNVTNMKNMFNLAYLTNPDTSNWDTSSVTIMSGMFSLKYYVWLKSKFLTKLTNYSELPQNFLMT